MELPALNVNRKSSNEIFRCNGVEQGNSLADFWKWSVSDLVSNATRGLLAEYLDASALGKVDGVRREWDAYDIRLRDGTKIEVKSSAYCQSWAQRKLSRPSFSIRQSYGWDAETNIVSNEQLRNAEIYVFCLLAERDQTKIDPMNLDQWEFYVVPAKVINEHCRGQKTIGLWGLLRLEPRIVGYDRLGKVIKKLARELRKCSQK